MGKRNNFLYYLGNTLITLSLLGLIYTFYPLIAVYLFPPQLISVTKQQGTFVTIPKIHAQAPVTENVNPWNEKEYNAALKKSIAHAKGTALPGEKGTIFLFAHSSGLPWELTRFNTIFLRLGELKKGDEIRVVRNGKTFLYKVQEKKEVSPTEVQYLVQTQKNQLILQTCTPIGTSLRRLLVFAEPM